MKDRIWDPGSKGDRKVLDVSGEQAPIMHLGMEQRQGGIIIIITIIIIIRRPLVEGVIGVWEYTVQSVQSEESSVSE